MSHQLKRSGRCRTRVRGCGLSNSSRASGPVLLATAWVALENVRRSGSALHRPADPFGCRQRGASSSVYRLALRMTSPAATGVR
jgi:hypothetical protein